MKLALFVVCLILARLLFVALRRWYRRLNYKLPPGPKDWPVVGRFVSSNHLDLFDHRDLYGDISYINQLGIDIIILNSIPAIREALTNKQFLDNFSNRPPSFTEKYLMSEDVAFRSPHDPNWVAQRRLMQNLLRQYGDGKKEIEKVITAELRILIKHLDKELDKGIFIREFIEPSLVNIIDILAIGVRHDYSHWRLNMERECLNEFNDFISPLDDACINMFPFIRFLPTKLGQLMQHSKYMGRIIFDYLLRYYYDSIPEEKLTKSCVVFEMFRQQERYSWINREVVEGFCTDLNGAGLLTTSGTLMTFVLVILHHTKIQRKIQAEIDSVIGREIDPDASDRHNMPYTMASVLELLRYTSVIPLSVPHSTRHDTTLMGYTIPGGSTVLPNLYRVLHDEEYWDKPFDFKPSRFLDENNQLYPAEHPTRKNSIPFGVGKRACLGEVFAKTRIFLYITFLLQNYDFYSEGVLPSCDPRALCPGATLLPQTFKVWLKRRLPEIN